MNGTAAMTPDEIRALLAQNRANRNTIAWHSNPAFWATSESNCDMVAPKFALADAGARGT
jgi:hypothetical protein